VLHLALLIQFLLALVVLQLLMAQVVVVAVVEILQVLALLLLVVVVALLGKDPQLLGVLVEVARVLTVELLDQAQELQAKDSLEELPLFLLQTMELAVAVDLQL
jgi:hypothetical protein